MDSSLQRRPHASATTLSRTVPLLSFLLWLLVFASLPNATQGARASRAQRQYASSHAPEAGTAPGQDLIQRSYASGQSSLPSTSPSTVDGYTLGDVVLVSGIDGSLTALDRADGQVRWNLASSSLDEAASPSEFPAPSAQPGTKSAFGPLISTKYGKRRLTLANILASASDDDDAEEDEGQSGFASGSIDGLPSRTRHLLNTVGIYVVEPGSSGTLYLLTSPKDGDEESADSHTHHHPGGDSKAHMQKLPLTLPQLVSLSPFSFPGDKGRVFTGSKHTKLLRIDPLTGSIDRTWDADGAEVENLFHQADDESTSRWAYLARTDFTLSVSLPRRPHLTQTLHYSTYSPQSSDTDLAARWMQTYSDSSNRHNTGLDAPIGDGKVILPTGLDRDGRGAARLTSWNSSHNGVARPAWTKDVPSQIVEVFDLLMPSTNSDPSAHPVIVPHPPFALRGSDLASHSSHIFDGLAGEDGSIDDEQDDEETLLTFSPETGSLYALSSRRFPAVVRRVNTAWAGLDEEQRETRSLVTGGSFHHPMQCRTFGCWLGRYRVYDQAREADSRGLLEAGMGRLGIGAGAGRAPLEISDHAANPDKVADDRSNTDSSRASASSPARDTSQSPTATSRFSKKMLLTQAVAIFVVAAFTWLVRKGLQEQSRVQRLRNEAVVNQLKLEWSGSAQPTSTNGQQTVKEEAVSNGAAISSDVPAVPRTETAAKIAEEKPAKSAAETSTPTTNGNNEDPAETADGAKKKKRRRGKRAGAAVKLRTAAHATAANDGDGEQPDDSGGSDDDDQAAKAKPKPAKNGKKNGSQTNSNLPPSSPVVLDSFSDRSNTQQTADWDGGWIKTGPGSKSAESQLVELAAMGSTQGYQRIHATSPLETSEEVLGFGSSGTVVVKGRFQNRVVAVKRLVVELVHLASQEISLLESADDHPNVIRYFYKEQRDKFLYIALELCPASLADIVENPGQWQDLAVRLEPKKAVSQIASGIGHLHGLGIVHRDIKPPNILVAYANPHAPSTSSLKMLLSDFGLSKRIDSMGGQNSFSQTMHHPGGTAGWRAPEILRGDVSLNESGATTASSFNSTDATRLVNGSTSGSLSSNGAPSSATNKPRLTRAVDVFSFGCLAYYLLTSGDHPFGARYEREVNIIRGNADTSRLSAFGEEGFEANHLIQSMIQADPTKRPRALQVLSHPYFWDAGKRLAFLQDVSDRLEVIDRERDKQIASVKANLSSTEEVTTSFNGTQLSATPPTSAASLTAFAASQIPPSEIIRRLETNSKEITEGGDWTKKVDKAFMDDLGKWRKYHGHSVRDLLRALRNKKHHYQDMPPALRRQMGSLPDGFLGYFTKRFPKLFLHVYEVVEVEGFIRSETTFEDYFARSENE